MTSGNSFTAIAMSAGLFAGLLVLGAYTVRRISARDPSGRHWLLRSRPCSRPCACWPGWRPA